MICGTYIVLFVADLELDGQSQSFTTQLLVKAETSEVITGCLSHGKYMLLGYVVMMVLHFVCPHF